jgi:type II secretory pathway pseudopilin PulG
VAHRNDSETGFTLTELAIVVGILGMILGAIWLAAGSLYSTTKINKASQELQSILANMRTLYGAAQTLDTSITMTNSVIGGTLSGTGLAYIQAGIFPNDALNTGNINTATVVNSPWANGIIAIMPSGQVVAGDSMDITFTGLPKTDCVKFIKQSLTQTTMSDGLFYMWVGPSGSNVSSWASNFTSSNLATFSDLSYIAANMCTNTSNFVGLGFSLH